MGTTLITQEEEKLAEPKRKLKVIVPPDVKPSEYLENSSRFNQYNIESFEKLRDFMRECFDVEFDILYIGKDTINLSDFSQHDYIAFLSMREDSLGGRIDDFANLGIPVVFIRHTPKMECEVINLQIKENECFKNRPKCNGERLPHCKERFFQDFKFDNPEKTIPRAQGTFKTNYLPIFPMNFLIDFLIWYGKYGIILKEKRDAHIWADAKADTILSNVYQKTLGDVLALKSKLKQG